MMNATRICAALIVGCSSLMACGDMEEEEGLLELELTADASFALTTADECATAFAERPFLQGVSELRGWGSEEIDAICAEIQAIDEIRRTYGEDTTMTVMTVAGLGTLAGSELGAAYYIGAAGYDLTRIREWLGQVRGARAVRKCGFRAARTQRDEGALPEGFIGDCLEDVTGVAYPDALFKLNRSSVQIDEVGERAAGLGLTIAIYNNPGRGTAVAFLAGVMYAQADPAYGAFIGCGAALGFEHDAESRDGALAALCLGAEY